MTDYSKFFVRRERHTGESFVTLVDDAPEWLREAVRDAHCGEFPDGWIYAECRDAVMAFDDGRLTEDWIHEYADGAVELYQWAADHCLGTLFAQAAEEADELGADGTITERLQRVQYCAICFIAETMRAACEAAEESDAEET